MSALPIDDAPAPLPQRRNAPQIMTSRRVAIILFNLGGPDSLAAVRPFLFNLFNDAAILSLPQPFRFLLAQLISRTRAKSARANYAKMGGKSPLLEETEKQARALETALAQRIGNVSFKCFPAMRYWRPLAKHAARAAADWGATDAILLPLYPHYSSTTTASSFKAWRRAAKLPHAAICCYSAHDGLAQAHADALLAAWRAGGSPPNPRVLFSAHGLPQRVVDAGDPYQWQIERSAAAIAAKLPPEWQTRLCYQSRVGPLQWLGPSTEQELERAAVDGAGVLVCPIAFVSEHIETLVELDIDYAERAKALGLPFYLRAAAPGCAPRFIDALADLTERALAAPGKLRSESGGRLCPAACGRCPQGSAAWNT